MNVNMNVDADGVRSWPSPYADSIRQTDADLASRIDDITRKKQRELAERTRLRVAELRVAAGNEAQQQSTPS